MTPEKWYPVPKYPNYVINDRQEVRHIDSTQIKKCYMSDGYKKLNVDYMGKKYKPYLHQMVGWTFVPNPDNKPELHHIDENKLNNEPSNLMWVTKAEHRAISKANGQIAFKLTVDDVIFIRKNFWAMSQDELAEKFSVSPTTIYSVGTGRSRKDVDYAPHRKDKGITKTIIDLNTGIFYESAEELAPLLNTTVKELRRRLSGERYNDSSYRYAGEEDSCKIRPMSTAKPKNITPVAKFDKEGNVIEKWADLGLLDMVMRQKITTFLNGRSNSVDGFFYKKILPDGSFLEPQSLFLKESLLKNQKTRLLLAKL